MYNQTVFLTQLTYLGLLSIEQWSAKEALLKDHKVNQDKETVLPSVAGTHKILKDMNKDIQW